MATRLYLTPRGTGILGAGIFSILVAFYAFHLLLFSLGIIVIGFVAVEAGQFAAATRGFDANWFEARRSPSSSTRVNRRGVGSLGVQLRHRGRSPFFAEVFDALPGSFQVLAGSSRLLTWWGPGDELKIHYAFRPSTRGFYNVGPTTIVAHDAFGLAFRPLTLSTPWNVVVTPPAPALLPGRYNQQVRSHHLGSTTMRQRGYGTEFRSLRDYTPSDDYRSIAWKRSGRGRLFVREFEQENRQDFLLLLDVGRTMGAGLPGEDALDRAVDAAMAVAQHVWRKEDHFGLLVFGADAKAFLPPGRGRDQSLAVIRTLTGLAPLAEDFNLEAALDFVGTHLNEPTHVLCFSALTHHRDRLEEGFRRLTSRGHHLYMLVPELFAFYPGFQEPLAEKSLSLAREVDARRVRNLVTFLRGLGIPVMTYTRRGAVDKALGLYARLRSWGFAG